MDQELSANLTRSFILCFTRVELILIVLLLCAKSRMLATRGAWVGLVAKQLLSDAPLGAKVSERVVLNTQRRSEHEPLHVELTESTGASNTA
jgi:hypothetical protein